MVFCGAFKAVVAPWLRLLLCQILETTGPRGADRVRPMRCAEPAMANAPMIGWR
jgi:hypothetical protein